MCAGMKWIAWLQTSPKRVRPLEGVEPDLYIHYLIWIVGLYACLGNRIVHLE